MQKHSISLVTLISTEMSVKMCSSSQTSHAQFSEAYDDHLMRQEGSLDSTYIHRFAVI